VPALLEFLDHFPVEGGDVAGLAARHETVVHDDLPVNPVGPGVLQVGPDDGQEVTRRPLTVPASIRVQGPWQIAATGFPEAKNALTNRTAASFMRSLSGFMTPPGRRSAS